MPFTHGRRSDWCRLLAAPLIPLVCAGCSSAAELARENTDGLTSDATEGIRLAQQVDQGKAGSVFAPTHAQELQDDVDQIRENVVDEQLPGHEGHEDLSGKVSDALGAVALHPTTRRSPPTRRRRSAWSRWRGRCCSCSPTWGNPASSAICRAPSIWPSHSACGRLRERPPTSTRREPGG